MLEIMQDYPDDVVAVRAVGKITADDYAQVLVPAVNERIEKFGVARVLCLIGDRYTGLTLGAAWSDLMLGVSRWRQLGRLAVVTDVTWIVDAVHLFAPFFHHPVRVFPTSALAEAHAWICETDAA